MKLYVQLNSVERALKRVNYDPLFDTNLFRHDTPGNLSSW